MLKQRFLKNSAKVISVSTILLFISNLIVWAIDEFPGFEAKLGFISKLPDLVIYIFTFLTYLALNDEKSAHRKIKDIKSQKKIKALKGFLLFVFISNFFKMSIKSVLLNQNSIFCDIILNLFFVLSSFSFFLLLLSVWYYLRDKNEGKIKLVSLVSIAVSLLYAFYKVIFGQVVFPVSSAFENIEFLNAQRVQYAFCLVQYSVNIIMLVLVKKHYEKKELESEEKEKSLPKQQRPQVVTIELQDSFGIDNIDDFEFSYESTEDNDE